MTRHRKRGPRIAARARVDVQLPAHDSSPGPAEQATSPPTDDLSALVPLRVRPLAFAGDLALVEVDGLVLAWDVRGLKWLHDHGHVRCDCGHCSEATQQ